MEQNKYIETLKELTSQDDIIKVGREVNELRTALEDYILEETRKMQVAQLEAADRGEELEVDELPLKVLRDEFYEIYNEFKDKRKTIIAEKQAIEAENLSKKRALIKQLEDLVANEENIGVAFNTQKEILEKWKVIGDIPRDKRQDVQQTFSRLLEDFFYNMKIYKEIKEYDFKKNQTAKEEVVARVKNLLEKESDIKSIEAQLKVIQDDWEDIGPVPQEEWERLKEEYYGTIKQVYDKIRAHYDERRAQLDRNIELKKELLEKAKDVTSNLPTTVSEWNGHTDALIALQAEWKTVGFGPKKENEEVWQAFRSVCDGFFEAKSEFFKGIQSEFDKVADKKKALIDKVEALKTSTDWKLTTKQIIDLQKRWKELGSAGQRHEQRLWKTFRAACDFFFDAKKAHFESLDKENEANLTLKLAVIEKIKQTELPSDQKEALELLRSLSSEFNEIGHVPFKKKDEVYKAYKEAIDNHYKALKLEGEEKEKILFQAHLNTLKGSGQADKLFDRERQQIRQQIDEVKQQIIQYENNLGFFSNSKGANSLKAEVERKIKNEKERIDALKSKLKLIPNE